MPTCQHCLHWLTRDMLVPGPYEEDHGRRDRCPYDGTVVDMAPPLPPDGGPRLGLKFTPPEPLSRSDAFFGCMAMVAVLYVAVGVWIVLPFLGFAAVLSFQTGSWIYIAAWIAFAGLLGLAALAVGHVSHGPDPNPDETRARLAAAIQDIDDEIASLEHPQGGRTVRTESRRASLRDERAALIELRGTTPADGPPG